MSSNDESQDTGSPRPGVSLIITVLNEAPNLTELLVSIESQTFAPREIIIVDGGSDDDTLEILRRWQDRLPLQVHTLPEANISVGRNFAIERASGEIIAVTDAGVVLERDWLQRLLAPLEQDLLPVAAVGGFFEPDARTTFEIALAAATLPDIREVEPRSFLPSSRSFAFRRCWFDAEVRYPEWIDYCEDLLFDLVLKSRGAEFAFQPRAIVKFRPRATVGAYLEQYYRYARGDGKAGLFGRRHLIRYLTYLLALPSMFIIRNWWWRGLVAGAAGAYMSAPLRRLLRRESPALSHLALLFAMSAGLRALGDLAKMAGYPAGLYWRHKRYSLRRDWRSIPFSETDHN